MDLDARNLTLLRVNNKGVDQPTIKFKVFECWIYINHFFMNL